MVRLLQLADGHVLPDIYVAIETTMGMFGRLSESIDDILENNNKKYILYYAEKIFKTVEV